MPTIEEIAKLLKEGGSPDSFALSTGMVPTPQPGQFPGQDADPLFAKADQPMSAEEFRRTMPNIGGSIAPTGAAGALINALKAAPKTAAALGTGAGMAGMVSRAGEAAEDPSGYHEPMPVLDPKIQARVNAINETIKAHKTLLAANEALKASNPQLYARRTAKAVGEIPGLEAELVDIQGPHKEKMKDWQNRFNAFTLAKNKELLDQQAQERKANTPFQVRNEWWNDSATPGALGAEGALGLIAGLTGKGKMIKPMLTGAGAGGLSGALISATPNLIDAGTLPYGSKNQQGAWDQLTDPNFLKTKLLPEALLGGGTGALSAYVGSKGPVVAKSVSDMAKSIAKWLKNPTGAKAPSVPRAPKVPVAPVVQPPVVPVQPPVVQTPNQVLSVAPAAKPKRSRAKKAPATSTETLN